VELVGSGPCARLGLRTGHAFLLAVFLGGAPLALLLVGMDGLVPSRHVWLLEMDFPAWLDEAGAHGVGGNALCKKEMSGGRTAALPANCTLRPMCAFGQKHPF
jgi:hypothetical protein